MKIERCTGGHTDELLDAELCTEAELDDFLSFGDPNVLHFRFIRNDGSVTTFRRVLQ